jgi:two-component system, LytTR family, sensor kinase
MKRLSKIWKLIKPTLGTDSQYNFWADYARVIFFWNPAVNTLFLLAYSDFQHTLRTFAISNFISFIVATFCMLGSQFIWTGFTWIRKHRGLAPSKLHWGWKLVLANLLVPAGLRISFEACGLLSSLMGWPWSSPSFGDYREGLLNGLLISSSFFLFRIWKDGKRERKEYELRVKTLENETLRARMAALNYQMNPHLLFNSLNTIASMIPQKPEAAEDMVVQLSELYRGILVSLNGSSHSLERELELVRNYLNIEHARFGARVRYNIEVDPTLKADRIDVPVLLLQTLVENSIKHGLSKKPDGGQVDIRVCPKDSEIQIIIDDDGVGLNGTNNNKKTGIGIQNCKQRLQMTYGERASLRVEPREVGTRCEILFPFASQTVTV